MNIKLCDVKDRLTDSIVLSEENVFGLLQRLLVNIQITNVIR